MPHEATTRLTHVHFTARRRRAALGGVAALVLLLAARRPLCAQTLYVANNSGGKNAVGAYNASTGVTLSSFISPNGLSAPDGLAVSGNNLYVADNAGGGVSLLTATTGTVQSFQLAAPSPVGLAISGNNLYVSSYDSVNKVGSIGVYAATGGSGTTLVSGLTNPQGLTLAGSILYYADAGTNKIGAYNTATGSALGTFTSPPGVSASVPNGVYTPIFLAVSADGKDLFVANQTDGKSGTGTVGEYDAVTGAVINANFLTGLTSPRGLAVSGDILYVSSLPTGSNGLVGEYRISNDSTINANFLVGDGANGLAISPVPEPATWLGGALLGLVALRGVRRARRGRG